MQQRSDFDFDVISGPSAPPLPPRPATQPQQGRATAGDAPSGHAPLDHAPVGHETLPAEAPAP
jgi:hypothetical protein